MLSTGTLFIVYSVALFIVAAFVTSIFWQVGLDNKKKEPTGCRDALRRALEIGEQSHADIKRMFKIIRDMEDAMQAALKMAKFYQAEHEKILFASEVDQAFAKLLADENAKLIEKIKQLENKEA